MAIDPTKLKEIYESRPDLQRLYSPQGVAINANLPEIAGIPTLEAWAMRYGLQEYPELDPRVSSLLEYFTPDEIKNMPEDIKTGLAAFAEVQQKNFELGKVNAEINAQTWADAMRTAQEDPTINAKYGDELAAATQSVGKTLEALDQGYNMLQASTARTQELDRQKLAETEDAAGRAFSGFRKQAEERLSADQNDVIQSNRMKLKQALSSTIMPYESRFGSDAVKGLTMDIAGEKYDPVGNLKGSFDASKEAEQKNLAADFFDATQLPTSN